MLALHLSFEDGMAWLWGEGSAAAPRRRTRAGVPAHPRDAGTAAMIDAIHRAGVDLILEEDAGVRKTVWLPAAGAMPLPSSPALDVPAHEGVVALRPFAVTAHPLDPEDALAFVQQGGDEDVAGRSVVFGPSIAWYARATRLALRMVLAESFLPGLLRRNGGWEARWHPLPNDAEARELDSLASALPPVGRCLSSSTTDPPRLTTVCVTRDLLAHAVDRFVRWGNDDEAMDVRRRSASLHDAWLKALWSERAIVSWKQEQDVLGLEQTLSQWARAVRVLREAPFALCFRLLEPVAPAKPARARKATARSGAAAWRVEYLLQPKADPSLLLPIDQIWKADARANTLLARFGAAPVEFLLTALGQAAGISPDVAASLKKQHPGGFTLTTEQAWHFLREQAAVLQSAGYTVLLPSWWVGRGPAQRLSARVTASSSLKPAGGAFTLDALATFNVAVSLGGMELSLTELRDLAAIKAPLVNVRGQWTHVDQADIATALRMLEQGTGETLPARDLLTLALGGGKKLYGLPVESVAFTGWLDELASSLLRRETLAELPQPEGFNGALRPYQLRGFSWLAFLRRWGLGACLADDMGLGKTVQTLALLLRERRSGERRPVLLVCPTTVINNWRKEAERFAPELSVLVHHGIDRKKRAAFTAEAKKHALVVSSYGLLYRDGGFLREIEWSGLILDEAQNIKNADAKQSQAARAIRAEYRIALTGTPVENHVGDLWSLMDVLNPGLLGTRGSFTSEFLKPIQMYGDSARMADLRALSGPFILRRMKTDRAIISDLPDKIEAREFCTLTKEQATLYQAVVDEVRKMLAGLSGMDRRGFILAMLMRLKQICNHPAQFLKDGSPLANRSGKLARLIEILREIRPSGERTLVFTQFAEMGEALQKHLREYFGEEVFFLHGGTPRKRRDEMVQRFQNDEHAPRVFILSLKAGGTGLNLTRANHVVHFDRWWNPAVENQATDRAFRIGQQRNVMVRTFIVAGTLEDRIDEVIAKKSDLAKHVVAGGEQWLTELSNQELFSLLQLGVGAMEESNGAKK
jgi:superfamily II DNA or RNA helicase